MRCCVDAKLCLMLLIASMCLRVVLSPQWATFCCMRVTSEHLRRSAVVQASGLEYDSEGRRQQRTPHIRQRR